MNIYTKHKYEKKLTYKMVDIKNIKFVLVDKYSKENVFSDLSEIQPPSPNPKAIICDYLKALEMEKIRKSIVKLAKPEIDLENERRVMDFFSNVEMKKDLKNYEEESTGQTFSLPIFILQQGSFKLFELAKECIEFNSDMLFQLNADQLRQSIIERLLVDTDGRKFLNYFLTLDFGPFFNYHYLPSEEEKKKVMSYLMNRYDLNYIGPENNNSLHNALLNTTTRKSDDLQLHPFFLQIVINFLKIEQIDLELVNVNLYNPEELYLKQIFITKKRPMNWDDFYVKIPSNYNSNVNFLYDTLDAETVDALYPNIFTLVITKSLKENFKGKPPEFLNNYVTKYISSDENVASENHEQLIFLIKEYKEKFEEATFKALLSKLESQRPENQSKRRKILPSEEPKCTEIPPPTHFDNLFGDPFELARKYDEPPPDKILRKEV